MITLFEDFKHKKKLMRYLIVDDFNKVDIKDFIINDNGVYKIPSFNFKNFDKSDDSDSLEYYDNIKYNSLIRFYLFYKLRSYKVTDSTDNAVILKYIEGLKSLNKSKIEIINKIPNSRNVFDYINNYFNFGYPPEKYNYDNINDLTKVIKNYKNILSDDKIVEYINIVLENTLRAKKAEKIVKGVLNNKYGYENEIVFADEEDDIKGVDIWMYSKLTGDGISVQVKDISENVDINVNEKKGTIQLKGTRIDLHDYDRKEILPYDYLCFYLNTVKKVLMINTKAITSIKKERYEIFIQLIDNAFYIKTPEPMVKLIVIPKKLLEKDYTKIFY